MEKFRSLTCFRVNSFQEMLQSIVIAGSRNFTRFPKENLFPDLTDIQCRKKILIGREVFILIYRLHFTFSLSQTLYFVLSS